MSIDLHRHRRYVRGHGLGREKQGIAKPVEAKLRGKNVGLGFGDRRRAEPEVEVRPAAAPHVGLLPPSSKWLTI